MEKLNIRLVLKKKKSTKYSMFSFDQKDKLYTAFDN